MVPAVEGRTGIHSKYACFAAAIRADQEPSLSGVWFVAPPFQALSANSWSSQMATTGCVACMASASGSVLWTPCRMR